MLHHAALCFSAQSGCFAFALSCSNLLLLCSVYTQGFWLCSCLLIHKYYLPSEFCFICKKDKKRGEIDCKLNHKGDENIVRKVSKEKGKQKKEKKRRDKDRKDKEKRGQWGVELRVDVHRFSLWQPSSPSDTRPSVPHLSMSPLTPDLSIPQLSDSISLSPVGWMRLKAILHTRLCWCAFAHRSAPL